MSNEKSSAICQELLEHLNSADKSLKKLLGIVTIDSSIETKRELLDELSKIIQRCQAKNIPIPEDSVKSFASLSKDLELHDELNNRLIELRGRLQAMANTIPVYHRKNTEFDSRHEPDTAFTRWLKRNGLYIRLR